MIHPLGISVGRTFIYNSIIWRNLILRIIWPSYNDPIQSNSNFLCFFRNLVFTFLTTSLKIWGPYSQNSGFYGSFVKGGLSFFWKIFKKLYNFGQISSEIWSLPKSTKMHQMSLKIGTKMHNHWNSKKKKEKKYDLWEGGDGPIFLPRADFTIFSIFRPILRLNYH